MTLSRDLPGPRVIVRLMDFETGTRGKGALKAFMVLLQLGHMPTLRGWLCHKLILPPSGFAKEGAYADYRSAAREVSFRRASLVKENFSQES